MRECNTFSLCGSHQHKKTNFCCSFCISKTGSTTDSETVTEVLREIDSGKTVSFEDSCVVMDSKCTRTKECSSQDEQCSSDSEWEDFWIISILAFCIKSVWSHALLKTKIVTFTLKINYFREFQEWRRNLKKATPFPLWNLFHALIHRRKITILKSSEVLHISSWLVKLFWHISIYEEFQLMQQYVVSLLISI